MKTLDRYIARLFVLNFGILFVVLMSLFVVVDLIVDLDEFLHAGQFWGRRQLVQRHIDTERVDAWALTDALFRSPSIPDLMDRFSLTRGQAAQVMQNTTPPLWLSATGVLVMLGDYYGPVIVLI